MAILYGIWQAIYRAFPAENKSGKLLNEHIFHLTCVNLSPWKNQSMHTYGDLTNKPDNTCKQYKIVCGTSIVADTVLCVRSRNRKR